MRLAALDLPARAASATARLPSLTPRASSAGGGRAPADDANEQVWLRRVFFRGRSSLLAVKTVARDVALP